MVQYQPDSRLLETRVWQWAAVHNAQQVDLQQLAIKLCPRRAYTYALPLFCDGDLETDPMTVNPEGVQYILKMYLHTMPQAFETWSLN